MKKLVFAGLLTVCTTSLYAQDCTTNPAAYTNYVLAGNFAQQSNSDGIVNDMVMVNRNGSYISIDVLADPGNGQRELHKGTNSNFYNLDNVNGRMVKGDFDNDGHLDDFILIYKTGTSSMRFDLFASDGGQYTPSFTQSTFYTLSGYDPDKITGRVVSGDFDNDGSWDDIAAFYDYGNGETRIHLFRSNGSTMVYSGSTGWWNTTGYSAGQITSRVVSGDFDRDGKIDDIAAFYDYGGGQTRIHVWLSNGSTFNYQTGNGWWSSFGYTAAQITNRVVSLNIDRDNKEYDDIAVFYDYGSGQTRMHVFESTGSSFTYSNGANGWWSTYGYTASNISGKLDAIDSRALSMSSKVSDIVAFYNYGPTTDKYHMWEAQNPLFGSPYVVYGHHQFCPTKSAEIEDVIEVSDGINVYPNPTTGSFLVNVPNELLETGLHATVVNAVGEIVYQQDLTKDQTRFDLTDVPEGMYFVKLIGAKVNEVIKIVKH